MSDWWFVKISLRHRHAPMVGNGAYSHKIDYITAILLNAWIVSIGQSGEASRWRVCYQRGLPRLVFLHIQKIYLSRTILHFPENSSLFGPYWAELLLRGLLYRYLTVNIFGILHQSQIFTSFPERHSPLQGKEIYKQRLLCNVDTSSIYTKKNLKKNLSFFILPKH